MPPAYQSDHALTVVPPEWRVKVIGTLINPDTLLATDYLNHFNEAVMLIGMVADMPEILADLQEWKPKSYPEHFRNVGIDYGPLAAEAYDHVPHAFKEALEITIGQLNLAILITVKRFLSAFEANDSVELRRTGEAAVNALTALVGTASGIIAGRKSTLAQNEIDRLLAIC